MAQNWLQGLFIALYSMNTAENINSSTDNRASDGRKQSPPAFLDLADSIHPHQAARLGTNMPDISACLKLRHLEHERQHIIQQKLFEEQILAVSAPTTPPRVNTALHGDNNFIKSALSHSSVDAEVLFKAVGSVVSDKRKSVAYAPSVDLSPELGSAVNGQYNRVGAKSMPASHRTFTNSHDKELVEHFRGMALSGERPNRATPSPGPVTQSMMVSGRCNKDNHARPVNQFASTRIEDLQDEIPALCKDQHGCRYLQKKLEEDPFGNYLCQKLLEYSTDEQRNVICESVVQDLIHSIIVVLSLHVVVLIKDLNGNHVIQKCLNKVAPEDNQFIYNAVAVNCVEVATHCHGCCVLQRCIDHASDHQCVQLVNEIAYNALTLVQDPYGNYYILDLNDNRFSDGVIHQFTGNKFSSNVIEKCIRVAEHSTRKMLVEELLNRSRLEKLLRDLYGNYCVQVGVHTHQIYRLLMMSRLHLTTWSLPSVPFSLRAFAQFFHSFAILPTANVFKTNYNGGYHGHQMDVLRNQGIRPVLPLIRNTPYGKHIQNKLQCEQVDNYNGGYYGHQMDVLCNQNRTFVTIAP
ncbi:ARM repeat-containing protein [Imleria badia]|nr:ARM repeat-containing protein [Imleria badia]